MAWNQPGSKKPGAPPSGAKKPAADKPGKKPDMPAGGGPAGRPPELDAALKKLASLFGGGLRPLPFVAGVLLAFLLVMGLSGFQRVKPDEEAVVFRLGHLRSIDGPGLYWHPPLLDRVTVLNVKEVRQATLKTDVMLADESLSRIELSLQYRIAAPADYLLQQTDADALLLRLAESVLRDAAGSHALGELSGKKQAVFATQLQSGTRALLLNHKTGLELVSVSLASVGLPDAVKVSQLAAQRVHDEARRQEVDAASAAGTKLSEARAAAEKQLAEADVYRTRVISEAQRDVRDFSQALADYRRAPQITEQRLRDEALHKMLSGRQVVMVDDRHVEALRLPDGHVVQAISLPAGSVPANASTNTRVEPAAKPVKTEKKP
jgi:membrane protease subunit HflK